MGNLDISKIKVIPSCVEVPVYNNQFQTKRSFCSNSPCNQSLIYDINNIEDNNLYAVFDPTVVLECSDKLFSGNESVIKDKEKLERLLKEILIRFDTSPEYYTKLDYNLLIKVLTLSLRYLYETKGYINIESLSEYLLINKTSDITKIDLKIGNINTESSTGLATVQDVRNELSWEII